MANENHFLRALRKEDFLDLTFELVNLSTEGTPLHLVRNDINKPALLIVHFPPQHIAEEAFPEASFPGPVPARAMLAGPSRLVFKLPDDENNWPLTLETLLKWELYQPKLADNALPPGAVSGPGPKKPAPEETALEIPTGLYLSPDKFGVWNHSILPAEHNGRYELWHTRLGNHKPGIGSNDVGIQEGGTARVIGTANFNIPFPTSLSKSDPTEIAQLSSDFSLPKPPIWFIFRGLGEWKRQLANQGLPFKYIPSPIHVRQLMLSTAGAWANLESAWNYPTITDANNNLGYPQLGLEQWQHVTTQGRDQYVKTVRKAFLCDTGHRVSIITITERKFTIGPSDPNQSTAFLRKRSTIELQEPVKDYSELADAYSYKGNEMPFRKIHITTRSTPVLSNSNDLTEPFWPEVGGKPFKFQMVAEDHEGNMIAFERPLYCVPLPLKNGKTWKSVVEEYNTNSLYNVLRNASIQAQSIAFTETTPSSKGKTSLKTENLVFEAQELKGKQLLGQPMFLPTVKSATVSLPAVEQILGRPFPVDIEFEPDYLTHGFDPIENKSEIFAILPQKFELPFPAEKAGGLIKPDTEIAGLSRSLGAVANLDSIKNGKFDISMFDKARFLGGIILKDILKAVDFDPDDIKVADLPLIELQQLLDNPKRHIKIPMLTSRPLDDNSIETRYLWKPVIQDYKLSSFFQFMTRGLEDVTTPGGVEERTGFHNNGQLVIHVRLITSLDGNATYEIKGELREIALNFVKALKLKFKSLSFNAENGKKTDVSADGMEMEFLGPMKFVETLKNILPTDGFSDPPFLEVTPSGIRSGYSLGLPSVGVGIFSLQNINLSAALTLPFIDQPAGVRFSISERHRPFLVTVGLFGGGGFFSLALSAKGIEQIEASIEFGGNISLNLGVASGGVSVMAGIYFGMKGNEVKISGYLRCGGFLSVLGLISITVEFYLAFTYREKGEDRGEVWGQASLTVGVKVAFFSKSVTLTVERRFAGAAGDPTFAQMMGPEIEGDHPAEWEKYCNAFA